MKDNMSPGGSEGANFLIYFYYKLNDGNYYYTCKSFEIPRVPTHTFLQVIYESFVSHSQVMYIYITPCVQVTLVPSVLSAVVKFYSPCMTTLNS